MIEMVIPFCTLLAINAQGKFLEKCEIRKLPYTSRLEGKDAFKECMLGGGLSQLQSYNNRLYKHEKEWTDKIINDWHNNTVKVQVIAPENKIHRLKPGRCQISKTSKRPTSA